MNVDLLLLDKDIRAAGTSAARAEALGHHAVWATEAGHDVFLQALTAVHATDRIPVGTAIAVAFARTPMTVAHAAWDLAQASDGRFVLGLGSQVRAHVERRFSMPWDKPLPQMRDFINATRAIWDAWRNDDALRYEGTHYTHTLMSPFWAPAHHDHKIPIHLAAVGPRMIELAGELCDGVVLHAFTNSAYLTEVVRPSLDAGRARSLRSDDIEVSLPVFMVMGDSDEQLAARRTEATAQIAFYGSTPAYRPVLDAVGYGELQPELAGLAKAGKWDLMSALVTDEVFDHFALAGTPEEMPGKVAARFGSTVSRVSSYLGWPIEDPDRLQDILAQFAHHSTDV